jgi:hypothetical protein
LQNDSRRIFSDLDEINQTFSHVGEIFSDSSRLECYLAWLQSQWNYTNEQTLRNHLQYLGDILGWQSVNTQLDATTRYQLQHYVCPSVKKYIAARSAGRPTSSGGTIAARSRWRKRVVSFK